jgi:hypothetical protein
MEEKRVVKSSKERERRQRNEEIREKYRKKWRWERKDRKRRVGKKRQEKEGGKEKTGNERASHAGIKESKRKKDGGKYRRKGRFGNAEKKEGKGKGKAKGWWAEKKQARKSHNISKQATEVRWCKGRISCLDYNELIFLLCHNRSKARKHITLSDI